MIFVFASSNETSMMLLHLLHLISSFPSECLSTLKSNNRCLHFMHNILHFTVFILTCYKYSLLTRIILSRYTFFNRLFLFGSFYGIFYIYLLFFKLFCLFWQFILTSSPQICAIYTCLYYKFCKFY